MPPPDRAVRRRRDEDIARRSKTIAATGLPRVPGDVDLAAVVAHIERHSGRPAEAARQAHVVLEATTRPNAPLARLACKRGCAFCCHGTVAISAPEAFRLASVVKAQGATAVAGFRARAEAVANLTPAERLGAKRPCPLLGEDGACSVYDARPLACRQVTAFDVTPCREEFEGQTGDIAVPDHYARPAGHIQTAVAAAVARIGATFELYELAAAVRAALAGADAERRWLKGEPVFAGVWTSMAAGAEARIAAADLERRLKL